MDSGINTHSHALVSHHPVVNNLKTFYFKIKGKNDVHKG